MGDCLSHYPLYVITSPMARYVWERGWKLMSKLLVGHDLSYSSLVWHWATLLQACGMGVPIPTLLEDMIVHVYFPEPVAK